MKKMKTAVVAAAIAAVAVMGAAPAQAGATAGVVRAAAGPGTVCPWSDNGDKYICEYGVTQRHFPGGVEQFIIGSDYAVWTRWRYDDSPSSYFGNWVSLGGIARSEVFLEGESFEGAFITRMTIVGTDGRAWQRIRPDFGASWTGWDLAKN
ncbi:hypothetical protein [Streptomyces sp. NPDC059761]|uniref:hypothetical protein n=1 Tax=Streptomyces sp. NPDC059761 TaxID=3346937 RepID=UPI003653129F